MIDLRQPSNSKYTPEQIAAMKKNAEAYLVRSRDMFKILNQKKEGSK